MKDILKKIEKIGVIPVIKLEKIEELGIETIDEKRFLEIFNL